MCPAEAAAIFEYRFADGFAQYEVGGGKIDAGDTERGAERRVNELHMQRIRRGFTFPSLTWGISSRHEEFRLVLVSSRICSRLSCSRQSLEIELVGVSLPMYLRHDVLVVVISGKERGERRGSEPVV